MRNLKVGDKVPIKESTLIVEIVNCVTVLAGEEYDEVVTLSFEDGSTVDMYESTLIPLIDFDKYITMYSN